MDSFRKGLQALNKFQLVSRGLLARSLSSGVPKVRLTSKAREQILEKLRNIDGLSEAGKDPANFLQKEKIHDSKAAVKEVLENLAKDGCEDSSALSRTVEDFLSGAKKAFRLSGLLGSKNKKESEMSDEEKLREAFLSRGSKDIILIAALLSGNHQLYQKKSGQIQAVSNALSVARGGVELLPHNDDPGNGTDDDNNKKRISAIALLCRETNRSTLNYVIEAQHVHDQLPKETQEILKEPIFYLDLNLTQGGDSLDPDKVTRPFPIFSLSEKKELEVCYDAQFARFMKAKESKKYSAKDVEVALRKIETLLVSIHHAKLNSGERNGDAFVIEEQEALVLNHPSTMHAVGPRPLKLSKGEINEGDPKREVVIVSFEKADDGIDLNENKR